MVAKYGYDGLRKWVERGIGDEASADPDGVDVCRLSAATLGSRNSVESSESPRTVLGATPSGKSRLRRRAE